MKFQGKVVWITGASSGIGAELARQLSGRGARLVLSARRTALLEQVREECGGGHWVEPLDLAQADALQDAAERVWRATGGVDVLINNAGVGQRGLAMATGLEVDRLVMEVNYFGAVALTKAVVEMMLARRSGAVVAIASLLGKFGVHLRSSYSASKHALAGFMDCLRAELTGSGVTVHVVYPGWVVSELGKHALTADGSAYNRPDSEVDGGMSTDVFVRGVLRALERDKAEVVIARGMALLGYHVHRLAPNAFHWAVPRLYRRRR